MGLKEVCAQWSAFVEAKTAWNLRHDCLRVGGTSSVLGRKRAVRGCAQGEAHVLPSK